jgi:hypothetical protein
VDAIDRGVRHEADVLERRGQREGGDPAVEGAEHHLQLESREWLALAAMDAVTQREVVACLAVQVQPVRVGKAAASRWVARRSRSLRRRP